MRFIYKDQAGYQLDPYFEYLRSKAEQLPPGVRAFILPDWHYDITHHQCPHDSWLENITVREVATGERSEVRHIEIEARFLGAYHDGYFELIYERVRSYALSCPVDSSARDKSHNHSDWMVDEITLGLDGGVRHEIEFVKRGTFIIDCADIRYRWLPRPPPDGRG